MKVLGISGSPRKGGNTDTVLDKALEGAASSGAEVEKLILNDLEIAPVQEEEYESVNDKGLSIVDDEMQIVFRKIEECDALILASPIFFGSLSAQAKTMIDRFQCVWVSKNILKKEVFDKEKIGAFICVEATEREDFFENAKSIVRHFFATINVDYKDELFCAGVDRKTSVLGYPEQLEKAFQLGVHLAS